MNLIRAAQKRRPDFILYAWVIAMFKRLKGIKDLLWAAGLGLALLALLVGLVAATFTPYHGDRERPVMQLKTEKPQNTAPEETAAPAVQGESLKADGTLHPLAQTEDAGESYLDSLTILCDSSFASLRGAGLCKASIWSSETGNLPMSEVGDWSIRYPGDGSSITLESAVLIDKPKILVIAVGSDGVAEMNKDSFTESYTSLIRTVLNASPKTIIVCLSPCSVTTAYSGADGFGKDKAVEVNGWIKSICISTGAYYGDLTQFLCVQGYLHDEYADGSGRALNNAGLRVLLNYLRDHSIAAQ